MREIVEKELGVAAKAIERVIVKAQEKASLQQMDRLNEFWSQFMGFQSLTKRLVEKEKEA